jgi:hypothetical protein
MPESTQGVLHGPAFVLPPNAFSIFVGEPVFIPQIAKATSQLETEKVEIGRLESDLFLALANSKTHVLIAKNDAVYGRECYRGESQDHRREDLRLAR